MNHHEQGLSIRRRRGAPYATAMGDQASEHVAALIMMMKMGHHAVLLLPVCTTIYFRYVQSQARQCIHSLQ